MEKIEIYEEASEIEEATTRILQSMKAQLLPAEVRTLLQRTAVLNLRMASAIKKLQEER